LIEHVPYRGVQLTAQGRRAALKMIRRHRILELYLTQHLGYDWGGVHAEAEQLEHAVSDELVERMASALGHPLYDPHGDPIPTAAGEIEEAELVSLADAPVGLKLELRQVGTQESARLHYLAEQGLTPGVLLTVSERQPFNGPTTIALVPSGDPRVVGRELAQVLWCREVPVDARTWWRRALAFAGPGYLVAVGYMDPGNWASDLAGGSAFGYALLSVILISNLMAILLQGLAAKLGIVTGRDLAQACRDHYSRPANLALWLLCEVAIAACDLAEVIGSAIA